MLDLGCNNGDLMKCISRGENWEIVGVELFKDAAVKARESGVYKKVIKGDVTNLPKELKNKKYDVVFSSQVLEHLPKNKGERALMEWEKFAKKRVVVSTTNGFINYEPIENRIEENNIYQTHLSSWSTKELKKRGFTIVGQGAKIIYGVNGLARKTSTTLLPVWGFVSYFLAVFVYFFPKIGSIIICKKDLNVI